VDDGFGAGRIGMGVRVADGFGAGCVGVSGFCVGVSNSSGVPVCSEVVVDNAKPGVGKARPIMDKFPSASMVSFLLEMIINCNTSPGGIGVPRQ